jgi:hypothetical protein
MLIDIFAAITTASIFAAIYLLCVDIRQLNRLRSPGQNSKTMAGR